ncbi:MAG TPA: DUF559 domain-containing protein [Steroidobacteraceae bacterium]|nr:DUF559 domain-containing protein [Steroidobacteraceae bacterium]
MSFKRQHRYVVDFACLECRVVIELDGGQHAARSSDVIRNDWLKREGFEVVRIWNNDVFQNLSGVLEYILQRLNARKRDDIHHVVPSPGSGRGTG